MQLLEWPSVQHIEFDRLVEEVEDFEHLPDLRAGRMYEESEADGLEDAPLNELILAGLVSPV
ncbi:MAG TPA: hypothetical protein VE983_11645 [Solirubrobacteraceae bacterium]|nr:hypothetical protein [Solirubrobacteraceae bacterium]